MAKPTMLFGMILIILGVTTYFMADVTARSLTAFIPSGVGAVLLLCGAVAQNPASRKHAMHVAAFIGLLGFLAPLVRIIRKRPDGLALFAQSAMAVLCLVFLILCVNSFIAARRERRGFDVTATK